MGHRDFPFLIIDGLFCLIELIMRTIVLTIYLFASLLLETSQRFLSFLSYYFVHPIGPCYLKHNPKIFFLEKGLSATQIDIHLKLQSFVIFENL